MCSDNVTSDFPLLTSLHKKLHHCRHDNCFLLHDYIVTEIIAINNIIVILRPFILMTESCMLAVKVYWSLRVREM